MQTRLAEEINSNDKQRDSSRRSCLACFLLSLSIDLKTSESSLEAISKSFAQCMFSNGDLASTNLRAAVKAAVNKKGCMPQLLEVAACRCIAAPGHPQALPLPAFQHAASQP